MRSYNSGVLSNGRRVFFDQEDLSKGLVDVETGKIYPVTMKKSRLNRGEKMSVSPRG